MPSKQLDTGLAAGGASEHSFGFANKLQDKVQNSRTSSKNEKKTREPKGQSSGTTHDIERQERRRRDAWNYRYGYDGLKAAKAERTAEIRRREQYDARYGRSHGLASSSSIRA